MDSREMKYVVVNTGIGFFPVLLSPVHTHASHATKWNAVGAGFCRISVDVSPFVKLVGRELKCIMHNGDVFAIFDGNEEVATFSSRIEAEMELSKNGWAKKTLNSNIEWSPLPNQKISQKLQFKVVCYGESMSLNVKSRKEKDAEVIETMLNQN